MKQQLEVRGNNTKSGEEEKTNRVETISERVHFLISNKLVNLNNLNEDLRVA